MYTHTVSSVQGRIILPLQIFGEYVFSTHAEKAILNKNPHCLFSTIFIGPFLNM